MIGRDEYCGWTIWRNKDHCHSARAVACWAIVAWLVALIPVTTLTTFQWEVAEFTVKGSGHHSLRDVLLVCVISVLGLWGWVPSCGTSERLTRLRGNTRYNRDRVLVKHAKWDVWPVLDNYVPGAWPSGASCSVDCLKDLARLWMRCRRFPQDDVDSHSLSNQGSSSLWLVCIFQTHGESRPASPVSFVMASMSGTSLGTGIFALLCSLKGQHPSPCLIAASLMGVRDMYIQRPWTS